MKNLKKLLLLMGLISSVKAVDMTDEDVENPTYEQQEERFADTKTLSEAEKDISEYVEGLSPAEQEEYYRAMHEISQTYDSMDEDDTSVEDTDRDYSYAKKINKVSTEEEEIEHKRQKREAKNAEKEAKKKADAEYKIEKARAKRKEKDKKALAKEKKSKAKLALQREVE